MGTPTRRRGNLILLASVLCILVFMALISLSFLSSTDASTTANLVRELQATALAESIAVTVESRVNAGPWIKRFWFDGVTSLVTFSRTSGHFPTVGEGLDPLEWSYTGVVKDLDASARTYRIFVEVALAGERYTFSWDKRFEESLMGALNRDATIMDKRLDEDPAVRAAATDQLIDAVKAQANEPPPGSVEERYKEILGKLQQDEDTMRGATTVAAEPDASPSPPAPPVRTRTGR